jgi:hypothetical protein
LPLIYVKILIYRLPRNAYIPVEMCDTNGAGRVMWWAIYHQCDVAHPAEFQPGHKKPQITHIGNQSSFSYQGNWSITSRKKIMLIKIIKVTIAIVFCYAAYHVYILHDASDFIIG